MGRGKRSHKASAGGELQPLEANSFITRRIGLHQIEELIHRARRESLAVLYLYWARTLDDYEYFQGISARLKGKGFLIYHATREHEGTPYEVFYWARHPTDLNYEQEWTWKAPTSGFQPRRKPPAKRGKKGRTG